MALLAYGSEESVRKAAVKLNVARMIGNSEGAAKPFAKMANALVMKTKLDPKLREIAILRTAKVSHSVYEWTQHVPMAKHVGVTDAQVAAMTTGRAPNALTIWNAWCCASPMKSRAASRARVRRWRR
ncbi:MAG TPA: carboxymuconolactone decarboxylase family protein [Candidatus Binataceae bacterium]|jgi:alkylhydroperoxidase family enzyme|nr:carboxymuconolactone decarboxylase family protein [Candidatus Binataceae bacterium]